jgi:hypothetical protein
MLALNGFEAWGLEVSNQAVKVANENISSKLANPPDDSFGEYKTQRQLGSSKVILGDFFQRDWEDQIVSDSNGFDLIYDYTVSCVISKDAPANECSSFAPYSLRCEKTGFDGCRNFFHQLVFSYASNSLCGSL